VKAEGSKVDQLHSVKIPQPSDTIVYTVRPQVWGL